MEKAKSGLTLHDCWYIIKKYIVLEIAILLVVCAVGTTYALVKPDVFEAYMSVMVQAEYTDGSSSDMNQVPYTNLYIHNVCDFLSTDVVVSAASDKCGEKVSSGNIRTVAQDNRWIIRVSYKDYSAEKAKIKLIAIIDAAEELAQTKTGSGDKFLYFSGSVTLPKLGVARVAPVNSTVKTIALSAVAGMALALVSSFVLYFVSDRITTVDRIESITGVKNIQKIPYIKTGKKSGDVANKTFNLEKLGETMVFLRDKGNEKAYMIQSSVSGEGKSNVAASLARTLARLGKNVLVIECDFRKPSIHRCFRIEMCKGITDYFKDELPIEGIIKHCNESGVDVITCGEKFDNPSIIFMSGKFENIMRYAREKYDYILMDCPPAGMVSDYIAISRHSDYTVFVVGNDKISSEMLKNTIADLKESGIKVIGTVFNFDMPKNYEKNYYNYGYKEDKAAE